MAPKFSRELLKQVAAEMNDVMGLGPAIVADMMDDDTLLSNITWEATGGSEVKDAIRADDFSTNDPDKKLFSLAVQKFFADACIWDAKKKCVILTDAAPAPTVSAKEQAEQDEMDAGEEDNVKPAQAAPVAETPAPRPAKNKSGKTASAAPTGKAPKKEAVMRTQNAVAKEAVKKAAKKSRGTATQKKGKNSSVEMSCYGHRIGSGAALIDTLVHQGRTAEAIADAVVKEFKIKKATALTKVHAHVNAQIKKKGYEVTINDKGVIKGE